jgi:hypothetical protein
VEPIDVTELSKIKSPLEEPIDVTELSKIKSPLEEPIEAFACDLVITGIIEGIKVVA